MPKRRITLNVELDAPANWADDDVMDVLLFHLGLTELNDVAVDVSAVTLNRATQRKFLHRSGETVEPTPDKHGADTHPRFGMVEVNTVSSTPGAVLFDSDVRHQHYVILRVKTATRTRDVNRDWFYGSQQIVEVAMSHAQWGALVSSFGTSGVPATLTYTREEGSLPQLPFDSRLALSTTETRAAADKVKAKIDTALAAVEEKPTKANIRALRIAVDNSASNIEFAAKSLTEHVENVVTKARADIEAMIDTRARELGLDPTAMSIEYRTDGEPAAELPSAGGDL